jgi:hypothetical protein
MAVAEGFEPSVGGYPTHAFEACSLGRSDTPPQRTVPDSALYPNRPRPDRTTMPNGLALVLLRYHDRVAMNLRLTEQNEADLRAQAEAEGRSMNTIANAAIAEYVARWTHRDAVRTEIEFALAEHRELLERLK